MEEVDVFICEPIRCLKEILEWSPPSSSWNDRVLKIKKRSSFCNRGSSLCSLSNEQLPNQVVPRTLFCHDMKGGYLEDKFVDGSNNPNAYRFTHWSCIDLFVYFSHHFVTIPPLAWINAGHLHGVPVLGTIITEWEPGKQLWVEILSDPSKTYLLCEKLVEICTYYGFDGYLLNIENDVGPDHCYDLVDFVKVLKSSLASIKTDSYIIWYDSVTLPRGQVSYQNKLNVSNSQFFDACDGIFLNYNWSKEDLALSAGNSGDRLCDVYVGIDVFGRGCYGGGGFCTNLAVEMAGMHGLSCAFFAPGWVHETCPENEPFHLADYKFWTALFPHLFLKGPSQLPFSTSFCQGYGHSFYKKGLLHSDQPWYNLSKQNFQPTDLIGCFENDKHCICYYDKYAFNGGGCLMIRKCHISLSDKLPSIQPHRLFMTEFKVTDEDLVCVSLATAPLRPSTNPDVHIILLLMDSDRFIHQKFLSPPGNSDVMSTISDFAFPSSEHLLFENRQSPWTIRQFELKVGNCWIQGIGCALAGDNTPILLGEISISIKTTS